ncbi:aldose 1-epimerase family protein [Candidatus Aerophobetes bacterium]|nr:aldose 1-epimerase family protein [Candidatus Aerophobetes bacterium]
MVKIAGEHYSPRELVRLIGDLSQVAGVKPYELTEGRARGARCVDVWTGSGFEFTVMLERGMDITRAFYNGKSLCWRSSTGDVHPHFFEPEENNWLRSFPGGLLVTCGLTQAGFPCEDEGEKLGLHGRISHIPAEGVKIDEKWQDEDYILSIEGKMRQSAVFGENIILQRKIWTKMGESRFWVEDKVENRGQKQVPLMILYHFNIGFPVVREGSRLLSPSVEVEPADEISAKEKDAYAQFPAPTSNAASTVYYHKMRADEEGMVRCALINDTVAGEELGVYMLYRIDQLPNFVEWKMMGEGEYVVGMEPANCRVEGRAKERQRGTLKMLQANEEKQFWIEFGVLQGKSQIEEFEKKIR